MSSLCLCLVCFLLVFLVFFLLPWKLEIYAHAPCLLALISLYITCKAGTNSVLQAPYCTDYHGTNATCVRHACHLPCEVNGKKHNLDMAPMIEIQYAMPRQPHAR